MANYRYIKAAVWDDEWVANLSDAAFRLFMYCITNESTRLSGYYQKPMKQIAAAIGKDVKQVEALFSQLKGKIEYIEGWVCIRNYARHQNAANSPKAQALIEKDMAEVPDRILAEAQKRFNTNTLTDTETLTSPIGRVSIPYETAQQSRKKQGTKGGEKVGIMSSPYSEEFERAWAVYPRKVGKGGAWRAWQLLKPDGKLAELIIAKVALYKGTQQWKKDGGQFIPHFATFLNQRRFDDDPESGSTTSSKYSGL